MKIDSWKVFLFFLSILIVAYKIYPDHMEMASYFEQDFMYQEALEEYSAQIQTDSSVLALKKAAWIQEYLGEIPQTIRLYYEVLKQDPLNHMTHENLVRIYQWDRNYTDMKREYERYCSLLEEIPSPSSEQIKYKKQTYRKLQEIYSYNGEYKKLISTVEKILTIEPDNTKHYIDLMSLYVRVRDKKKALDIASLAFKRFASDPVVLQDVVYVYSVFGEYHKAMLVQEKIVELYPNEKNFWILLLSLMKQQNDLDAMNTTCDHVVLLFPNDYDLLIQIAQIYRDNKKHKKAIELYIRLSEKFPHKNEYHEILGQLYAVTNDIPNAISEYELYRKYASDNLDVIMTLIDLYLKQNNTKQANKLVEVFNSIAPKNTKYLYERADLYEWISQPEKAVQIYLQILGNSSYNEKLYKKIAQNYEWAGKYDLEQKYIEALIEHNPDTLSYKISALTVYEAMHNTPKSFSIARKLIKLDPDNKEKYEQIIARIYIENKDFIHAYPLLKKLYKHNPDDIEILEEFAWISESVGQKSYSIHLYEKLILLKSPNINSITSLANLYINVGAFKKAVFLLEDNTKRFPHNQAIQQLLAQGYVALKQYNKALGILRKLQNSETDNEIVESIAYIFYMQKNYKQAQILFEKLYASYPNSINIATTLAGIYTDLKQYYRAIDIYKHIILRVTDYQHLYTLANLYEITGNQSLARLYFKKTVKYASCQIEGDDLIRIKARCFQKIGKDKLTLKYYKIAITHNPDDLELFRDFISYLVFSRNLYQYAVSYIATAPQLVRNDTDIQNDLAQAYIGLKDFESAELIINSLLRKSPHNSDLLMNLAFIMQNKGRWDKAFKIYQDIIRTGGKGKNDAKKEAKLILKTYAPNLKTGYLLIEEINKDTRMYHTQAQAYLTYNLLARAGWARYIVRDRTNSAIGNIRNYFSEWSFELEYFISSAWSVQLGPLVITNSPIDIYTLNFGLTYNNNDDLFVRFNYSHDDKLLDPRSAIPFGGRSNHVDISVAWDVNDVFKFVFEGIHTRYKFDSNVRRLGITTTPGTRNQFIIGTDVTLLFDPHISVQYRYVWDDSHIDRTFSTFFPLSAKTRSHELTLRYEDHITENLFVYGTFLVGQDDERDLFIKDFALYGYGFGSQMNLGNYLEIGGYYQFRVENGMDSQSGRTHYVDVYGTIHF